MARETLKVGGLFSEKDTEEIESMLAQLNGVEKVQANLKNKTVIVDYDEQMLKENAIKKMLQSMGHDPSILK